ncbi:MAG: hypothetical protein JWM58_3781 [Rhizobium sp.]|jgi:hypothetical protein|nr:hypothetical protein [Rhizobium sp.]
MENAEDVDFVPIDSRPTDRDKQRVWDNEFARCLTTSGSSQEGIICKAIDSLGDKQILFDRRAWIRSKSRLARVNQTMRINGLFAS